MIDNALPEEQIVLRLNTFLSERGYVTPVLGLDEIGWTPPDVLYAALSFFSVVVLYDPEDIPEETNLRFVPFKRVDSKPTLDELIEITPLVSRGAEYDHVIRKR